MFSNDVLPKNNMHHRQFLSNPITTAYDWEGYLRDSAFNQAQASLIAQAPQTNLYRSGASSLSDLKGLMQANVPVCVNMLDTSANVRQLLIDYSNNTQVLLDSGAFRLFKSNIKSGQCNTLDFDAVLMHYQQVIFNSQSPNNIVFVAPDVVGEQLDSLSLFQRYIEPIISMLHRGANVMLPLQKGNQSLSDCYQTELSLIPIEYHAQIVIGLPFNAEALSVNEILEFVTAEKPSYVHFLGASENQLVHRAKNASPNTHFSNDATRIRQWIGKGRLLTTMHEAILDSVVDIIWTGSPVPYLNQSGVEYDFTEFLGNLTDYVEQSSSSELKRLANKLCVTAKQLLDACANDQLVQFIDNQNFGYSDELLYQFHEEECRKKLSPQIRQYSVYRLAEMGVI